jgi:hypothetical protein
MNKKNGYRAGLGFGVVMTIFYFVQTLLTSNQLTTTKIVIAMGSSLVGGAVSTLLFTWLSGVLIKSKFVRGVTNVDLSPDETIVFQSPANHFKGMEAVGGMLYLTSLRLIFKSHRFNIQNHQCSINLNEITTVDTNKTLGVVNNGLIITIIANHTEKFVVSDVNEWVAKLNDAKNSLHFHHN